MFRGCADVPGRPTLGVQNVIPGRQGDAKRPVLVRCHSRNFRLIRCAQNDERIARVVDWRVLRGSCLGDRHRCRRNNLQVSFQEAWGNTISCLNPRQGDQAADGDQARPEQVLTPSLIRAGQVQRPGAASVRGRVELAPLD